MKTIDNLALEDANPKERVTQTKSPQEKWGDVVMPSVLEVSDERKFNLGNYESFSAEITVIAEVNERQEAGGHVDLNAHIPRLRAMVANNLEFALDLFKKYRHDAIRFGEFNMADSDIEGKNLWLWTFGDGFDPINIKKIAIRIEAVCVTEPYANCTPSIGGWFAVVGDLRESDDATKALEEAHKWLLANLYHEMYRALGGQSDEVLEMDEDEAGLLRPINLSNGYKRKFNLGDFNSITVQCSLWTSPIRRDQYGRREEINTGEWITRVREMARLNVKEQYIRGVGILAALHQETGTAPSMQYLGLPSFRDREDPIQISTALSGVEFRINLGDFNYAKPGFSTWANMAAKERYEGDHPLNIENQGGYHMGMARMWAMVWTNVLAEVEVATEKTLQDVKTFGLPQFAIEDLTK